MAKYFSISNGLRGCYMPDSCYTIKVNTRRELKSALAWEADSINDAGFVGLNKRAIAWLANAAWKRANGGSGYLDYVAPYGEGNRGNGFPYGLFCNVSTRSDYITQIEE